MAGENTREDEIRSDLVTRMTLGSFYGELQPGADKPILYHPISTITPMTADEARRHARLLDALADAADPLTEPKHDDAPQA